MQGQRTDAVQLPLHRLPSTRRPRTPSSEQV